MKRRWALRLILSLLTLVSIVLVSRYELMFEIGNLAFILFFVMDVRNGRGAAQDMRNLFAVFAITFINIWVVELNHTPIQTLSLFAFFGIEAIILISKKKGD